MISNPEMGLREGAFQDMAGPLNEGSSACSWRIFHGLLKGCFCAME